MANPPASPGQVWLDITSLAHCPVQPVGVVRTLWSVMGHWRAAGYTNLRFCVLAPGGNDYVEIAPEVIEARFAPAPSPPPVYHRRLGRLKQWLPAWMRHTVRSARGLVHATKQSLARLRAPRSAKPVPLTFTPRDLLIIAGLNWDYPDASALPWHIKRRDGVRTAALLYDIVPVVTPHLFGGTIPAQGFVRWLVDTLWAADFLWTISEHSRRDLLAFMEQAMLPARPVEVIRLGEHPFDTDATRLASPAVRRLCEQPFILTVGSIQGRKNHLLLYHAWRQLLRRHGPARVPKLVIAGAPGGMATETVVLMEHDPLTRSSIHILREASDADLAALYRGCLFTLFPSHYEGWGLPVAESLNAGKYCIASEATSVPEIGGELVGYHDPEDLPGLLARIDEALCPDFRRQREAAIRGDYRPTPWADCARRMIQTLESRLGPCFHKES